MSVTVDQELAELRRANAELKNERDTALTELQARSASLAQRDSEYSERREHQSATIDILKAMSASPGDTQPVFDLITQRAQELCNSDRAGIFEYDGELVHIRSAFGGGNAVAYDEYAAAFPMAPTRASIPCRSILDKQIIHIRDMDADPDVLPVIRNLREKSALAIPLLRDGAAIGAFAINAAKSGGFTESQVALLQTFAEQAVIANTSAETYRNLGEALEQQTATAEVLQVINASPGDLGPVFEALLDRAMHLCQANFGILATFDGECLRRAAVLGVPASYADYAMHKRVSDAPDGVAGRLVRGANIVHVPDLMAEAAYRNGYPDRRALVELGGARTCLSLALRKDDALLGMISFYRQEVRPFSERQIALLQNFAAQAVIAMENARLLTETREALEQQTATAEVLQVINSSPGDLTPVFDAMLNKALDLCGAAFGILLTYDGERFHHAAFRSIPPAYVEFMREHPQIYASESMPGRLALGERLVHVLDITDTDAYRSGDANRRAIADLAGARTIVAVSLWKDSAFVGAIVVFRQEVRPFSDKQIALLENFAAQGVIAMENARLLTEQREALEQQTATAEVLQVINRSPGDLTPVFDAMLDKAIRLCDATYGHFRTYDGEGFPLAAVRGDPSLVELHRQRMSYFVPGPHNPISRFRRGEDLIHISDAAASEAYRDDPGWRKLVDTGACRSVLAVALRKDTVLLGYISVYRQEVRAFSDKQIALLENFAAQAVIAMENARLLEQLHARTDELAKRQEELRLTFENMGDGVAMFDETPRLVAWNRKFQEIFNVPDALLEEHHTYAEYVRYLGTRGDFGPTVDVEEQIRRFTETAGEYHSYERVRPDGRVIEIRHNPVAGGGFVLIYADITERKRNEAEIRAARDAAEEAGRTIEAAYRDLKAAQANLIQAEKMASLGQLTAGIAHEIKNPLNFVNNFSALSTELIDELRDVLAPEPLGETARTEVDDLTALLKGNLEKVVQHGQRADGIVRSMLDHSRGSSGERRMVDLNTLIDEALNLAYHGARAQDQSFNITLERDFGDGIAPIEVNPQDITRVFLNLFANGFYAVTRWAHDAADAGFVPKLKVTTRDAGEAVEIRVRDNGIGIPADIRDKLFQPFFTTKPTGEGTGLGLSITYDIVTQQHGGSITVDSEVGEYSEFTIRLPRHP